MPRDQESVRQSYNQIAVQKAAQTLLNHVSRAHGEKTLSTCKRCIELKEEIAEYKRRNKTGD